MIEHSLAFYRRWVSPAIHSISGVGGACRFQPTCSEYAAVAMGRYGLARGLALSLWRLLRCHPFARGGFDPVPGTYAAAESRPGLSAAAVPLTGRLEKSERAERPRPRRRAKPA